MEWVGIAFFHGLPVYVVGALTQSKKVMALAAVVMAAVAVGFGSPAFSVFDLIAVFFGFIAGTAKIESLQKQLANRAATKKEIVPGEPAVEKDSGPKRESEFLHKGPERQPSPATKSPERLSRPNGPSVVVQKNAPRLYTDVVPGSTLATVHWVKGDPPVAVLGNGKFEVKLTSHQLLRDATVAIFDLKTPDNYVFIRFWEGYHKSWRAMPGSNMPIGFGWVAGHEVEVISEKEWFVGNGVPCLRLHKGSHADGWTEAREGSAALAEALREWHWNAFHGASVEEHSEKEWAFSGPLRPGECLDARALYREKMDGAEIARTSGGAHSEDFMIVGSGMYEAALNDLMKVDELTYAFFDRERYGRHAFYQRIESEYAQDRSGCTEYFIGFGWVDNVEAIVTCRIDTDGLPYLSWQRGDHADNALISENARAHADRAYYEWLSSMFVYAPFETY